jgi:hypothetical protein
MVPLDLLDLTSFLAAAIGVDEALSNVLAFEREQRSAIFRLHELRRTARECFLVFLSFLRYGSEFTHRHGKSLNPLAPSGTAGSSGMAYRSVSLFSISIILA